MRGLPIVGVTCGRSCSVRRSEIRCVSGATRHICNRWEPARLRQHRPCPERQGCASVAGALASIDVQDLAGDEGCAFQEQDCVDNVPCFTHASDGMQFR